MQYYNPYDAKYTGTVPQSYQNYSFTPNPGQVQATNFTNPIWVRGKGEAEAYPLPAGGAAILMDSEKNVFYMKTRDTNGIYSPIREFEYTEHVSQTQVDGTEYATKAEFSELTNSVNELRKLIEDFVK